MSEPATMTPRRRRLEADLVAMQRLVAGSPLVRMTFLGEPPNRYRVTYRCRGIRSDAATGRLKTLAEHVADIYLHVDYPRLAPEIVWRTPIFHPNFRFADGSGTVCLPSWSPTHSLAELVLTVGQMVQYQRFDSTYAVNPQAAIWAAEHAALLPVDPRPLVPGPTASALTDSAEALS